MMRVNNFNHDVISIIICDDAYEMNNFNHNVISNN